jgi:hypothetical protein
MNYEYASIPTRYRGTEFRSRLEARWAAFADLVGWKWRYEPIDLNGWIPDFWFGLPCGHSECCAIHAECCPGCGSANRETFDEPVGDLRDFDGKPLTDLCYRCLHCQREYLTWRRDPHFLHELYAEVKPYRSLAEFAGHPVTLIDPWETPAPAKFGWHPEVTEWEMAHGAGGGVYSVVDWVSDPNWEFLWDEAGNLTRWKRRHTDDD